jgi:TATA-box binding protein (TBP) (component of TFIID and TFIIIB)
MFSNESDSGEEVSEVFDVEQQNMEDGCIEVNSIYCSRNTTATIHNVTTRHYLVNENNSRIKINLPLLAEYGRCSMTLSGPTSMGMPSVSSTFEEYPNFGSTKVGIHNTGKVVQIGYKSPEQALLCAYQFTEKLNRNFRLKLKVRNFEVVNMVACIDVGRPFPLDILKDRLGPQCVYTNPVIEKKLSGKRCIGGAIITSVASKTSDRNPIIIVYENGGAVLMGNRTRSEIVEMVDELFGYIDEVDAYVSERRLVVHTRRIGPVNPMAMIEAADQIVKFSALPS